jgi:cobalt-zinc-cadmium efflux system outer membrane protein
MDMRAPIPCLTAILLLGFFAPASPVHAQARPAAAAALTLHQAVARAQVKAPSLEGAAAGIRAADATVRSTRLLPNPTLSVEAENVLGTGRYSRFGVSETTYAVSMPLELAAKRAARVRVAEADREMAAVAARAAKADLTLRVTQAYIALAANERRLKAADTRRELAGQAEQAARLRVRSGKASPIEEQRAMVQRINAAVEAERADRATKVATANLARLLDFAQPLVITAPWFDDTDRETGAEHQMASPALAAADAGVAAAGARVGVARKARIPDLTISAGARRFNETNDTAAVLAISVPLPLFNRGDADIARASAELDQAEAERRAIAIDLEQALAMAQADVADARANAVAASGPVLAAASEAARIARIGYVEGKFSQLDLIEAERSLSQTQEAAIDALAALHDARARLARLLGRVDPIYQD